MEESGPSLESSFFTAGVLDGSLAFLKNSCDLSEKMVSTLVTANPTSLTWNVAGFGSSLARWNLQ